MPPSENFLCGPHRVQQEPPADLCPLEAFRRTLESQVSLDLLPYEDLTPKDHGCFVVRRLSSFHPVHLCGGD